MLFLFLSGPFNSFDLLNLNRLTGLKYSDFAPASSAQQYLKALIFRGRMTVKYFAMALCNIQNMKNVAWELSSADSSETLLQFT